MGAPLPTALDQLLIKLVATNGTILPSRQVLNLLGIAYANDNPTFQDANGNVVGSTDISLGWGPPVRKSGTYTGTNADGPVLANTVGTAWTYTFPPSPVDGQVVRLKDPTGAWSTHNLTVKGNTSVGTQKVENPYALGSYSASGGTQTLTVSGSVQDFMWGATESTWFAV